MKDGDLGTSFSKRGDVMERKTLVLGKEGGGGY